MVSTVCPPFGDEHERYLCAGLPVSWPCVLLYSGCVGVSSRRGCALLHLGGVGCLCRCSWRWVGFRLLLLSVLGNPGARHVVLCTIVG